MRWRYGWLWWRWFEVRRAVTEALFGPPVYPRMESGADKTEVRDWLGSALADLRKNGIPQPVHVVRINGWTFCFHYNRLDRLAYVRQ